MDEKTPETILLEHGVKPTANRIVVLRELASASWPLSLAELERRIETIDKSGIFRTLTLFKSNHLVHVFEDGGDGVRYELCRSHDDASDNDLHPHFFCESCRHTYCLDDSPMPEIDLPSGFRALSVNYMVKGLCPNCAAKNKDF